MAKKSNDINENEVLDVLDPDSILSSRSLCRPLSFMCRTLKSSSTLNNGNNENNVNNVKEENNIDNSKNKSSSSNINNDNDNDNTTQYQTLDSKKSKEKINIQKYNKEKQRLENLFAILDQEFTVVRSVILSAVDCLKYYLSVRCSTSSPSFSSSSSSSSSSSRTNFRSSSIPSSPYFNSPPSFSPSFSPFSSSSSSSSSSSALHHSIVTTKNNKYDCPHSSKEDDALALLACSALGVLASTALLLGEEFRPFLLQVNNGEKENERENDREI